MYRGAFLFLPSTYCDSYRTFFSGTETSTFHIRLNEYQGAGTSGPTIDVVHRLTFP